MTGLPSLTVTDGPTRIAHVRLNRPDKLNSLTLEILDELVSITRRIRDDRTIRAVVVSGEGRSFSAGLDFASAMKRPSSMVASFLPRPWRGTNQFQEACWGFRRLPVPVVAAVHGHCFGGGLQLAMAADWRITTADAQWSILESKWGLVPDMSGMRTLPQQVRADVLKKLTMTGEVFDGRAAVGYGLASEVSDTPVEDAEALATVIATRSPDAVAYAKKLVDETWTTGPWTTFRRERMRQLRLLAGKNTAVARKAAAKKVAPVFGRRSVG
ncbi:crotonase/enoyl-CoA hydratase family protein [Corynebacterium sp.]|uniref:crotonase/enoyl-CoA hydratase family protein n=1 Tax=Corynebacterium sp. TaxID=1720 RepID=UPI0025BECF33|nr:crotonase/enoyl-CoA hydratase family protein [Corynebacterium sp.]